MFYAFTLGTGKSSLILKFIEDLDHCFSFVPSEIIYIFSGTAQEKFKPFENKIKFLSSWDSPELNLEKLKQKRDLLIIVDDMYQCAPHDFIRLCFTQYNHHLNWCFILILHNLYTKELHAARSINLNSQMTIFLSSPRARDMVRTFAQQTHCGNTHFFNEVYNHCVENVPFGYLIFDSSVRYPNHLRLRTNVLKSQEPMVIFTPKKVQAEEKQSLLAKRKRKLEHGKKGSGDLSEIDTKS